MAAKPKSKKKSVSARRSVDAGDKDKLIIEQKNHIAVLENELQLKQDLSSHDIERERAEDALRINEKFLNNVFNCIQDGVSVLGKDLSIIRYNPTIEKWHGKDLTGKKCYRLFHGREEPCETCPSLRAMREKTMQREVVRDLLGWKELYAYPLVNDEGEVTGTIEQVRDITERKQAEETLRENNRFINTLMGNLPGMVYRRRNVKDWTMEYISSGCSKLTGYKIEDLFLDKKISYGQLIHPGDRERVWDETQQAIHANKPYALNYRIIAAGQEEKWVLDQGRSIIKNNKMLLEGFITDITETKRTEEELYEAKQQAELYLDLMGHDIRNMNMIGMGFLELAMGSTDIKNEDKEYLLKSLGSLENSTRLIDNVRKLQKARSGELEHQEVDACEMFLRVLAHFSSMPGVKVSFNYDIPPSCLVRADELLYEVFENVVGNAIKHGGPETVIDVRFDQFAADGRTYNRFIVEDNGPGIPDARKGRIFNRLQRGDSKAHGTGLGLYLVKSLVESYGGRVSVEDRVLGDHTKGARFVVMLPAVNYL